MRTTLLLVALILSACASRPSLEELEEQALATGNWEAVEKREQLDAKRRKNSGPDCPRGQTKVCIDDGSGVECICSARGGR